jgi:hypothetical protein
LEDMDLPKLFMQGVLHVPSLALIWSRGTTLIGLGEAATAHKGFVDPYV